MAYPPPTLRENIGSVAFICGWLCAITAFPQVYFAAYNCVARHPRVNWFDFSDIGRWSIGLHLVAVLSWLDCAEHFVPLRTSCLPNVAFQVVVALVDRVQQRRAHVYHESTINADDSP